MLQAGHAPNAERLGVFRRSFALLSPDACEAMAPELSGMDASLFSDPPDDAAFAFDAAAAVSLALRKSQAYHHHHHHQVDDVYTARAVRDISFAGASGGVSFDGNASKRAGYVRARRQRRLTHAIGAGGEGDRNVESLALELRSFRLVGSTGRLGEVHVPLHFSADHCVATLSPEVAGMIWPGGASKPPRDAIDVQEEEERRRQERQRALVWKLCVGLGVPGVLLLTSGVALLISYFRLQSRRKQLLWRSSRMPLHFSHCDPGGKYHLFLSHTWLSGQDQARAHQARQSTLARFRHVHGVSTGAPDQAAADHAGALDEHLPRRGQLARPSQCSRATRVPDAENLMVPRRQEFGHLAEEIAASDVVLLFLSRGYFASKAPAIECEEADLG